MQEVWSSNSLESLLSCLTGQGKSWDLEVTAPVIRKFEFFDDAAHRLYSDGTFLVKYEKEVVTALSDGRTFSWQQNKFSFAQDIEQNTVKEVISKVISIRLLDTIALLECSVHQLVWRDEEGKALLKGVVYQVGNNCLLVLKPIRGYEKANSWAVQQLTAKKFSAKNELIWQSLIRLAGYQDSPFNKIPSPKISGVEPARKAIFAMIEPMLEKARLNEDGIKRTPQDIEFLHEYRVSLRKSRSLVSLFKDVFPPRQLVSIKQEMGDLGRSTNQLRDLDVYLLEQSDYESLLPASLRAGIREMFDDFSAQHKSAKSKVKRWLSSKTYENKITKLQATFAKPDALASTDASEQQIYALVTNKLHKRYKKIAKLGSRITPETPDDEVHELRIECKKFRYLMEFFAPLYKQNKVKLLIKKLKKLQDTLGKFNDFSVQQESLNAYLLEKQPSQSVAVSVGALLGVLAQKQLEQRQQVEVKFAEFADQQTAAMVAGFFPMSAKAVTGEK